MSDLYKNILMTRVKSILWNYSDVNEQCEKIADLMIEERSILVRIIDDLQISKGK